MRASPRFSTLRVILAAAVAITACGRGGGTPAAQPDEILVAAAASLRELLVSTAAAFEAEHPGIRVRFSFEASSTLARQIEEGAPFEAFLSADALTMERARKQIDPATLVPFLGNRLALVVRDGLSDPATSPAALAERSGPVAVAGPEVPAGRLAREQLQRAGLLSRLEPRLASAANVRAALALVDAGAANYAFVYATDAKVARNARAVWLAEDAESRTTYVAAALARAKPAGRDYVRFLASPAFLSAAESLGFERPGS
jgi:molybdate transport system substrate-binding protein